MADNYSFQIERFKSTFRKGGARPNLFSVQVDMSPGGVSDSKLMFTCRAASVPAMSEGTIEVPYFGRKVKIAGDRTFAEWTVTVLNDEDWKVRRGFEYWQNRVNSHNENVRDATLYNIDSNTGYKREAYVKHYDKSGNEISYYNLIGCYPSEVGAIELAWDTNDTIEEFTVTFQYDYFKTIDDHTAIK